MIATLLAEVPLAPVVDRSTVTAAGVIVFILLMAISAFFSSSEIAMFSLAQHRIDALVEEGASGADRIRSLRQNPHRMLVTILVGNNLANVAMSSIATGLLALYFSPSESVLIATLCVTSLVLLFSESAPKSYAVENAESWALRIARPLQLTQRLLYPLVAVFDHLTRLINLVTGGRATIESAYITRSELQELIEAGEKQGVLEEAEEEILQRTFRFTTTIAREVMVPRADMAAVSSSAIIDEAIERSVTSGHTRLPVYDGDSESVLGTVHILDLIRERYYGEDGESDLIDLVRPIVIVPDTKPIDEVLGMMQRNRQHLAIVMDEFGSIGGLLSIEDIVEELVGEILRPAEEPPIEIIDDATAVVLGDVAIEAINEKLGIELPTEESYETVAGLLLELAGRLVEEGESFEAFGLRLSPMRVENGRILKIRIESLTEGFREG